jgi:ornithine cyclodeaminase/alanine dehydrogenase-like protein (mu-crystallin family)
MATSRDVTLLSGHDLRRLVRPQVVIKALREAYAALADHPEDRGRSVGFTIEGGSIHVKSALLPGSHLAFAAKLNVNLPDNWNRHQLPTIQGLVVLADARSGRPLAVMDSITLTGLRTAAAAALAASYGGRIASRSLAVIGCGAQAGYQLEALRALFPLDSVRVFDIDRARAAAFAETAATDTCAVTVGSSVAEAVAGVELCVTCTTSRSPVLTDNLPLAGCFVAAVGADNPEKQEIAPALMARARVLVDDLDACAAGGDLHHALRDGAMTRDQVHADLAELAAGRKRGRGSADELVIFDSTGTGVQDVAAAWAAYREALGTSTGVRFDLSAGG